MPVDFDTVPNRRGTNCFKYDFAREMGMPEDVLPLWVADMDFPTAPAVLERLHALAEHGIFGYTGVKDAYFSAVHNWYAQRFGWETQRSWLVTTPGVVFAIAIAIRAFTQKGDAILIQQPVYYPFANKVTDNDRQLVVNPLVLKNGRYEMDFADLEKKMADPHNKLLVLCNPQNPTGRVFTEEELQTIARLSAKYQVVVYSDEIFAEYTYDGHKTIPYASIEEGQPYAVACTGLGKAFNFTGVNHANLIIPDETLRKRVEQQRTADHYGSIDPLAYVSVTAAYSREGADWLLECRNYMEENKRMLETFAENHKDQVELFQIEGTFVAWMRFKHFVPQTEDPEELTKWLRKAALVDFGPGTEYDPECRSFVRINFGTQHSQMEGALQRLEGALDQLDGGILE